MEEVGLTGLTRILRGGVRIEKNPKLCYERDIPNGGTIDWKEILQSEYYTNYMKIEVQSTQQTVLRFLKISFYWNQFPLMYCMLYK